MDGDGPGARRRPRPLDQLADERFPAFYGDDLRGVPASDLFDEADARRAIVVADRLLDLYRQLLGETGNG